MEAGLYVTATPIGNLEDITYRAVNILRDCDLILAEDTRHTGRLLQRYEIRKPLTSCHKFNESSRCSMVTGRIESGQAVALVSNAGTPALSDPGARVVRACREKKLPVFTVPGPSSISAAMSISGIVQEGFLFEGFLPGKPGRRKKHLEYLSTSRYPVVLFESPYRLIRLLELLAEIMHDRVIILMRELTKINEDCVSGTPPQLIAFLESGKQHPESRAVKGEIILIVTPATDKGV